MKLILIVAFLAVQACKPDKETRRVQVPQGIPPPLPPGVQPNIPAPPTRIDPDFYSFARQEADQLEVLNTISDQERLNTRFVTICEQFNEGRNSLERYIKASNKALNAISTDRVLSLTRPVGNVGCVRTFDQRDFGLTPTKWQSIENRLRQVFGTTFESFTTRGTLIKQLTQTRQAAMPGHVFMFMALNNPVYTNLLELPRTLGALQTSLGVDLQSNFDQEDRETFLFGMTQSPISITKPRLVMGTSSDEGYYYLTYDAEDANIGRADTNPFESPFPIEARSNRTINHDGSEAIFSLANGMMGFYLASGAGDIQDEAPLTLVNDPGAASRGLSPVINYLSCHDCHELGIIPREDEICEKALRDPSFNAEDRQKVQFWHCRDAGLAAKIQADNAIYFAALESMGIGANEKDHINAYTNQLRQEATLEQVAALMSQTPEQFRESLLGTSQSLEQIGQLLNGDTVTFDQLRLTLQTYVVEANIFRNGIGE